MTRMTEHISRISKFFTDRNGEDPAKASARRRNFSVTLKIGRDVVTSRSLQLAALTAAKVASRCFPKAVYVDAPNDVLNSAYLVSPRMFQTVAQALRSELGASAFRKVQGGSVLLFGDALHDGDGLRVTFDGWIGAAGPLRLLARMQERNHCALAPILAAAFAISEVFSSFANLDMKSTKRIVALSLWRPDLIYTDPSAVGPVVTELPTRAWLLGLGHLGNAYLWAFANLGHENTEDLLLYLLDFDTVEKPNLETGILFNKKNLGHLKTRVCSSWLEQLGIKTRLIERHFDHNFRRRDGEPALALSGFDNNEARHYLTGAAFGRVIDSGVGGTANNFDSISVRTWPNSRAADDIWPLLSEIEKRLAAEATEKAARENSGYRKFDRCGIVSVAGKSVAVPFVGLTAATLVLADVLRLLNDGKQIQNLKVRLGSLAPTFVWSEYTTDDLAAVPYQSISPTR